MSFLVPYNSLYFKVYFVWYKYYYSAFFLFPFVWNIFFQPLTFSLYVSLGLKWMSYRQHLYIGLVFLTHPACLCLLIRTFNRFISGNYSYACLVVSSSLKPHGLQPARLLCLWGFSRQVEWSGFPCLPPRGSSQPMDWTQVSFIAGRFFTVWATREAHSNSNSIEAQIS